MVTTPVLYEVPLLLEEAGVGEYLLKRLGLEARQQTGLERVGEHWWLRCAKAKPHRAHCPGGQVCRTARCLHERARSA